MMNGIQHEVVVVVVVHALHQYAKALLVLASDGQVNIERSMFT